MCLFNKSKFFISGYGSGWDIILPSSYALPFWLTFIMFGARSGGLRETESIAFEMGECYLSPDSDAGKDNEKRIELELHNRYFSRPPSKRVNYTKIAINSPFICPWNTLLNDWSDNQVRDYFVLRNKTILSDIQVRCRSQLQPNDKNNGLPIECFSFEIIFLFQDCITKKRRLPKVTNARSCLVPVYIKLTAKGCLQKHSLICLPEAGDVSNIKTLFEPHREDPNEVIRKLKRSEHLKLLKKIRKTKIKLKKRETSVSFKQFI